MLAEEQRGADGGHERFERDKHGHVARLARLGGDDLQARRADEDEQAHQNSLQQISSAR